MVTRFKPYSNADNIVTPSFAIGCGICLLWKYVWHMSYADGSNHRTKTHTM